MEQKTYSFKRSDGSELKKTLALPVNSRLNSLLNLFDKKSFSELLSEEGRLEFGVKILDIGLDSKQLQKALDACLKEGSEGLDLEAIDLRLTDEVIQDFFEQRPQMFKERMKSSLN